MATQEFRGITAETRRMLNAGESTVLDYKATPAGVKAELLVALANSRGGTILVGVAEREDDGVQRGEVVGCEVTDAVQQSIVNKATECNPPVEVVLQIENAARRSFLRVDVQEGTHKPYGTSRGVYTRRIDGRNVPIDSVTMKALVMEAESEEFLKRFEAAGQTIIERLGEVHESLSDAVTNVETAAEQAAASAAEAADAAQEAADNTY